MFNVRVCRNKIMKLVCMYYLKLYVVRALFAGKHLQSSLMFGGTPESSCVELSIIWCLTLSR
jgi:hypothetical protein